MNKTPLEGWTRNEICICRFLKLSKSQTPRSLNLVQSVWAPMTKWVTDLLIFYQQNKTKQKNSFAMKFSHNLNQISLSRTSQLSPHYERTLMAKSANECLAENLTLGGLFKQKAHCSGEVKRSSPFWKFQFDSLRRKTALLVNEGRKRGFGALVRRRQLWCKIHWNAAACPDAVKLGHSAPSL